MRTGALSRYGLRCLLIFCLVGIVPPSATAIPSFNSFDNRLPNPDRPYELVGKTVHYNSSPDFAIYDLEFSPSNPAQLDFPSRNPDGSFESRVPCVSCCRS